VKECQQRSVLQVICKGLSENRMHPDYYRQQDFQNSWPAEFPHERIPFPQCVPVTLSSTPFPQHLFLFPEFSAKSAAFPPFLFPCSLYFIGRAQTRSRGNLFFEHWRNVGRPIWFVRNFSALFRQCQ